MTSGRLRQQLDGGWGWVVVGGSFLNHFLFEGMVRSYGLIYLVLLDRFHGSAATTAWIQASFNAVAMTTGPLTGLILERVSCRVLVLTGGVLLCTALLASSYAPNLYFLYFSYSAIGGLAGGFVYSPMVVVVSQYFDKKRGQAMGLAALGGAIGTVSIPPLIGCLLYHYGYTGCLTILAAIALHHCIAGAVYRPFVVPSLPAEHSPVCSQSVIGSTEYLERCASHLHPDAVGRLNNDGLFSSAPLLGQGKATASDWERASYCSLRILSPNTEEAFLGRSTVSMDTAAMGRAGSLNRLVTRPNVRQDADQGPPDQASESGKQPAPASGRRSKCLNHVRKICAISSDRLDTLANVSFLLFCFNLFNIPTTIISTFIFLPGLAKEYGVSATEAALLVSVIGAASGVGRLCFGFIFDMKAIRPRRRLFHSVLGVLLGLSTASVVLCRHFLPMVAVCSCIGLSEGGVMAQRATALSQYVRPQQLTFAFGIMTMFQGFGNLFGPLIQGCLKDRLGSYVACFCYGGGMTLLSSGLLIVDYLVRCKKTSKPTPSVLVVSDTAPTT